jgi:hypothetical protein
MIVAYGFSRMKFFGKKRFVRRHAGNDDAPRAGADGAAIPVVPEAELGGHDTCR